MYLLVIVFPLLSSITTGLLSSYIGVKNAIKFSICYLFISCLLSLFIFYEIIICGSNTIIKLGEWIYCGSLFIDWGFLFDSLTATMLVVVITVSFLVHVYSVEYMDGDPHIGRFVSYLSLFTLFMILLVTSDNLLILFTGWEGVGLCSYLLVSFWFTRMEANKSAIKAVLVNKIGDAGVLILIASIVYLCNTLDYSLIFSIIANLSDTSIYLLGCNVYVIDIIGLSALLGCIGKSAQIGLHTWLPDAMEGPTPVSALIHAATMVTAGVFLVIRISYILEYSEITLLTMTVFGALTALISGLIGMVQNDIKKVIAYSTCSQLGYMVFCAGLSGYTLSLFHLMNHAFFKALLFLGAGSVIHAINDEQDMRKMGGLLHIIPITYTCMLVSSLSLMGVPFLTGYYSKDIILEYSYAGFTNVSHFSFWIGSLGALLTSFYSIRLIYLTFLRKTALSASQIKNAHESGIYMQLPLFVLFFLSIFAGYFLKDLYIGIGTDIWGIYGLNVQNSFIFWDIEFIPVYIKWIPTLFSFLGSLVCLYLYHTQYAKFEEMLKNNMELYNSLSMKFNFDTIYNHYFVHKLLNTGYEFTFKNLDRGYIEYIGPYGLSIFFYKISDLTTKMHTGYVYNYSFLVIFYLTLYTFLHFILHFVVLKYETAVVSLLIFFL